jgi:phage terminase large subunit-like protein
MRGGPEDVRHLVRTVAEATDMAARSGCRGNPAQADADQADSYIWMLTGYAVDAERMSGDKVTRADAEASQCNIGRIGILRPSWNVVLLDELGSFQRAGGTTINWTRCRWLSLNW